MMDKTKELLKKAFYRGNEVADMPNDDWDGLADDWKKWYSENVENILPLHVVSEPLFKQSEVKMICEKLARACTPSAYIRGIDERFEKWWNATINAS